MALNDSAPTAMELLTSACRRLRAHAAFSSLIVRGITALDPLVIAVGVAGLAVVGLCACLLPARRATRINPVDALRSE